MSNTNTPLRSVKAGKKDSENEQWQGAHLNSFYFVDYEKAKKGNQLYGWHKGGEKGYHLGQFDLTVIGKINMYNPDTSDYDRVEYELEVTFLTETDPEHYSNAHIRKRTFRMSREDFQSKDALETILHVYTSPYRTGHIATTKDWGAFKEQIQRSDAPYESYEFDHFGFVDFNPNNRPGGGDKFFLAKDILITIPDNPDEETPLIISPDQYGNFAMPNGRGYHVKETSIDPAPVFDLDQSPDPEMGIYDTRDIILDDIDLSHYLKNMSYYFEQMTAGNQPDKLLDGRIIYSWMLSHLFMDEIHETFKHQLFLYIWGPPSTGKGTVLGIMLNFMGLPYADADSQPTLRSAENKLCNHSNCIVSMDEWNPDNSNITIQQLNSWFERRSRGVSSAADRTKNEHNVPRSSLVFCSNYAITEDHMRSRCTVIYYSAEKRGESEFAEYLDSPEIRELAQHAFISMVFKYNRYNRDVFKVELRETAKQLREAVKKSADIIREESGTIVSVKDRQINSLASLLVVYMITTEPGDFHYIASWHTGVKNDPAMSDTLKKETLQAVKNTRATEFFYYMRDKLISEAEQASRETAFGKFLSVFEIIQDKGQSSKENYGLDSKGNMVLYWAGVWDEYTIYQQGRDRVSENDVRQDIELLDLKGKPSTYRYIDGSGIARTKHGYKIPHFQITPPMYRAFGYPKKADELIEEIANDSKNKGNESRNSQISEKSEEHAPF